MRRSFSNAMGSAAVLALLAAGGCSSSSHGTPQGTSTTTVGVTTSGTPSATSIKQSDFDKGSLNYFPGTSLAKRTQVAQQLCDSIRTHGDNLLTWLIHANTDRTLFPYNLGAVALGSFTGLAVLYRCPKPEYLAELRQGIAGIPAGVNLGKPSP